MADEPYEHLGDDFWFDVEWHLLNMQERQRQYVEKQGGRQNVMPDDRYLTDFTLAWRNEPDNPPRWLIEETAAYHQQQKTTATSTTIGGGPTRVSATDASNVIQVWSSEGAITIQRADLPELIRVLQGLVAGPTNAGATGSSDISQRSAPRRYETRPNHPGWKSQAQINDEALERSIRLQQQKQDAIIRQQQLELQQRRNRW